MRESSLWTAFENIRYLAKKNGIRMRDIEMRCGVSEGYFSRNRETTPAIRFLIAAHELGVDIGDLFCVDFGRADRIASISHEIAESCSAEEVVGLVAKLREVAKH